MKNNEMLQRQELPREYTIADLVKEFPPDKYDFDVFEANVPFSVYQNLVNTNARPRTARELYKIAFGDGRTSIAPNLETAEQLNRVIGSI